MYMSKLKNKEGEKMSEKVPNRITCAKHKSEIMSSNFYIAGDMSIFSGLGYIPICKSCLYKEVERYYEAHKNMRDAIYLTCRKIDVAFDSNIYEGALRGDPHSATKAFMNYMTQINSFGLKNGTMLPFDDGEHVYERVISNEVPEVSCVEDIPKNIKMSKEDKRNRQEIIRLLEYDPFDGFSESDQKFLYSDLINYFGDEDVVEDQFLVSQIIQVVNNNNQIRKLDFLLSQYMADDEILQQNEGRIKSLNSTKKDIVANTDKIAKENRISVRSRAGSNISKSSLTVMMERLRAMDFDDAEVDFYDQKKAYGMKHTAEISIQAIQEQLQFDENDIGYMITEQRNMIKEMEDKILDIEDENRKLHIKLENKK